MPVSTTKNLAIRLGLLVLAVGTGACGSASDGTDTTDVSAEATEDAAADIPAEDASPADVLEEDAAGEDGAGETDAPADVVEEDVADIPEEEFADTPEEDVADVPAEDAPPADGGCDPARETPSPGGMCDGRGILACQEWARTNGGPDAVAVCVSAGGGTCARATDCDDTSDPTTCRCGTAPACVPGEVCVTFADASPACLCATGAP